MEPAPLVEEAAAAHLRPDEGDLRLGAIPTIGPFLIPPALPRLREDFPNLRFYLREEMTEGLIEGLNAGRLDLILIALPFDIGGLEHEVLFDDGYHLAAPHGWAQPSDRHFADSGKLMLLERGHCLQRHALSAFPDRHLRADESFAATSLTTLIAMVSEGLGITLLPDLAVDAGVDELFSYGGITPENVVGLVHGAMFTRGPADLKKAGSAIFPSKPAIALSASAICFGRFSRANFCL